MEGGENDDAQDAHSDNLHHSNAITVLFTVMFMFLSCTEAHWKA